MPVSDRIYNVEVQFYVIEATNGRNFVMYSHI